MEPSAILPVVVEPNVTYRESLEYHAFDCSLTQHQRMACITHCGLVAVQQNAQAKYEGDDNIGRHCYSKPFVRSSL